MKDITSPYDKDLASLKTILELEARGGFANRTVIGGLDKLIARLSSVSVPGSGRQDLHNFPQPLRPYAEMDYAGRKAWVEATLLVISRTPAVEVRKHLKTGLAGEKAAAAKVGPDTLPEVSSYLDALVTNIKGIGENAGARLARLRIGTVRDLLYFFPRRFMDFTRRSTISGLETGREQTVFVNVWEARQVMLGRMKSTEAVVGDETGNARAVWFNQPWIAKQLKPDMYIALSGRVKEFNFVKVFENPEWELIEDRELVHTGRLVPVYQLTQGLFPRQVRGWVKNALDACLPGIQDFLPEAIRRRCSLAGLRQALLQAHYPADYAAQNEARKRLAFDELFLLQLGVLSKKRDWQEEQPGYRFTIDESRVGRFAASLPFKLTAAQQRVTAEILSDLGRDVPMSRLIQGDVGSGKTVVAAIALLEAVANGFQGALMAPTEILAEQHFATLFKLLSAASDGYDRQFNRYVFKRDGGDLKVALLTGSLVAREKAALQDMIKKGEIDIVVGTHALVQKGVRFARLGLAVIDEQHRFGVLQRTALRQKGFNPHLLVMTATPIPRTLALTLYGDLDISTIDQMPAGRLAIKTRWLTQNDRQRAYNFIRKQVGEGRQAFIICPLVEESENLDVKAAVAEYQRLSSEVFPDLKLGLLHGRMKGGEKDGVMHGFKDKSLDMLVSTSVVEVGIDVPNATVMLVEAADRFGLAQLHQFRGRVGRGEHQSYCMLLSENPSEYGQERLKAIEEISDGFALAEKDLELRGPGEFFGTRQSGLPDLRMARLTDTGLLEMARREARSLFAADPNLKLPENRLLASEYRRIWQKDMENN